LGLEQRAARGDLGRERVTVTGRAALHDVGDVDLPPVQAGLLDQQPVEELARTPDERPPLQVLVVAGGLAHHQKAGMGIALSEDDGGAAAGEGAAGAAARLGGDVVQAEHDV
jgi:hypothetical protein